MGDNDQHALTRATSCERVGVSAAYFSRLAKNGLDPHHRVQAVCISARRIFRIAKSSFNLLREVAKGRFTMWTRFYSELNSNLVGESAPTLRAPGYHGIDLC